MGKDIEWKSYFVDNHRYADIINGIGCNGIQLVKDTDLEELDTASKKKSRDLLRKTALGVNFAIIGIENQEVIDYRFPIRNMQYDANEYQHQATLIKKEMRSSNEPLSSGEYLYGFKKDSRLHPVITFVLYSGKEPWDGPTCLHDILDFQDIPDSLKAMTSNYKINIIDIRQFENTHVFQTDVKHVFDFIRYSDDKQKLLDLVQSHSYYQSMDEDAFDIVTKYTNSRELVNIKENGRKDGKKDMCKAIRDLMEDSMNEGIENNRLENARNLIGVISDELIAEKIGLPLDTVKKIHEEVAAVV